MKPIFLLSVAFVLTACEKEYVQNPDLNHTHADFAVWADGEQVDFSGSEYMSGLSTDDSTHDSEDEYHHKYLHLHDDIGTVLHRHKPGLTLEEFFGSLEFTFDGRDWRLFVKNPAQDNVWVETELDLGYVFKDMDMVLITDSQDELAVTAQQASVTEDACMFSRTCPWRGDPPAENCIADPAVPCVVPEEDL